MFTLSDTELNILKILIQKTDFDSNHNFKGLTTYDMRKSYGITSTSTKNKGIASGNWTKYKDRLLHFQLVSETYEKIPKPRKPRKSESKLNFQQKFKTRYYVTPIGFLTFLQNLKPTQISDYVTPDTLKFLPLISKYLANLKKLDGVFYVLLKYAIKNIELEPISTDEIKKGERRKSLLNRQIQEKIILSFMSQETQMIFSRTFLTLSPAEQIIINHSSEHLKDLPNSNDLFNNVSNHLTFLFYFYLMFLLEDNSFLFKICSDVYPFNSKYKTTKFYEELPFEEFKKNASKSLILGQQILPQLKIIVAKIKQDSEIITLFDTTLDEIQSKLLSIDFLEYLSKTMTR